MKSLHTFVILLIALCLGTTATLGMVPYQFNFQGSLADSSGIPVMGTRNLHFYLYADSTGGSSLWNESHPSTEINDGLFRVLLGSVSPFSDTLFNGQVLWMEIVAQSETLSPRTKIVSIPYSIKSDRTDHATTSDSAIHAVYADTADWATAGMMITHVDTADFAFQADQADDATHANYSDSAGYANSAPPDSDWIASGDTLYHLNGYIGIGTSTPDKKLHIQGESEAHDACLHLDAWWNPEIIMDKGGYDADSKIRFQSQGIPWWTFFHDGSEDALKFLHDGSATVMTLSNDNKVGIGTMTPAEKLDVIGTIQMTGLKMSTGAGLGKVLTSSAVGVGTWETPAAKVGGTGTTNYLAKFSDSTTIANSIIFDDGSQVGIGTTTPTEELEVNGDIKVAGFFMPTGASNGYVLTSTASGLGTWQTTLGGSGTTNYLPIFTGNQNIGNSVVFQNGGLVGIGTTSPSHKLTIQNTAADDVLRLIGPDGASLGYGARLNFGDADYVYLEEDEDDRLYIYANGRTAIMGGYVGIGTTSPSVALHVNGDVLANLISTGLGYTEIYLMNQNVRTTDDATFNTINTGLGTTEVYPMNQYVRTTDAVTFANINTGPGATEVYLMNQNVRTSDAVTFTTLNTGLGNYELYAMNQNLQTTDNPTFNRVYLSDYGYALGGFHVGGTSDPGDDNLIVDGNTSMGTTYTTHRLVVANTAADDVLRLIGPDGGGLGFGARLNLGDGDYLYLDEDSDDHLYVYAANGTALMGGYVGVATTSPAYPLDVAGNCHASSFPTSSDARLKTNVQQLTGVLDKLEKIRGVSFDWNSTYEQMGRSTGHREIGVIAQEVEAQFPEVVTTWGDEHYRAVDYGRLTAVLIEAVKELKAENRDLKKEIEELKTAIR